MDSSSLENLFKNILDNTEIEGKSEKEIIDEVLPKLMGSSEFKDLLYNKDNPIVQNILKQSENLFNKLSSNNDIIDSKYCFFGLTENKTNLILSLKVPQLLVDKHILMEIIQELRTTVDYLESQEKKE